MLRQHRLGHLGNPGILDFHLTGMAHQKKVREQWNVRLPLPERRQPEGHDFQPVVEILAKTAAREGPFKVPVRRGDDPNIDGNRLAAAQPLNALFLKQPQDLRLYPERHVPDFVQKHGPAVGLLNAAHPPTDRPRERPFLVTEQLAFEQRFGNGHAIDHHEGLLGTQTVLVNRPGNELLPRPRLAANQHRGVRRSHPSNGLVDILHGLAPADDRVEQCRCRGVRPITVESHAGSHEPSRVDGLADQGEDVRNVEWLQNVIESAHLGRLDRRLRAAVGCHNDDGELRLQDANPLERLQAAHSRQSDIHDEQIKAARLNLGDSRLGRRSHTNRVSLLNQQLLEALPQLGVVVDDQDRSHTPSALHGRVMMNVAPFPSLDRKLRQPS